VIGKVTTVNEFLQPMDISLGLIHNGYATIYTGKGAEYDGNRELFEKEVKYAQMNRLGIWTNGIDGVQTPSEYKKLLKEQQKMEQATRQKITE
jgi:endonuclease YncB( thermonuclease family)